MEEEKFDVGAGNEAGDIVVEEFVDYFEVPRDERREVERLVFLFLKHHRQTKREMWWSWCACMHGKGIGI